MPVSCQSHRRRGTPVRAVRCSLHNSGERYDGPHTANGAQGAAAAGAVAAMKSAAGQVSSDQAPKVLDGKPMPEPSAERSAGAIKPGRGSCLKARSRSSPAPRVESAARSPSNLRQTEPTSWRSTSPDRSSPTANAIPATPERTRRDRGRLSGTTAAEPWHQGGYSRHRRAAPDRR